jgi:hypothetical protein
MAMNYLMFSKEHKLNLACLRSGLLFIAVFYTVGCTPQSGVSPPSGTSSAPGFPSGSATGDEAAKRELKNIPWVKDVHVSPGHMNVGVLRHEKDWTASMTGQSVCAILKKNGSALQYVRFVDIEEIAYDNKSPNEAQIYKLQCQ